MKEERVKVFWMVKRFARMSVSFEMKMRKFECTFIYHILSVRTQKVNVTNWKKSINYHRAYCDCDGWMFLWILVLKNITDIHWWHNRFELLHIKTTRCTIKIGGRKSQRWAQTKMYKFTFILPIEWGIYRFASFHFFGYVSTNKEIHGHMHALHSTLLFFLVQF